MLRSKFQVIHIAFILILSSCGGGGGGDGGSGTSNAGQNNSGNITGSSGQLVANQTYVVNAGSTRAMLQLPASGSLKIGDSVTVSGQSAGGWKFVQAADQSILTTAVADNDLSGTAGNTWASHLSNQDWFAVASSSDGMHLVAAADSDYPYTSDDGGETWKKRDFLGYLPYNTEWRQARVSGDGRRMTALSVHDGIFISNDAGETWKNISESSGYSHWSVAVSADGNIIATATWPDSKADPSNSAMEISGDGGKTWTSCASWTCHNPKHVDISADGNIMLASESYGTLYKSTDHGATWATIFAAAGGRFAMSADAQIILSVCNNRTSICVSRDGGTTWSSGLLSVTANQDSWSSLAATPNGRILAAGTGSGSLYVSTDAGANWRALVVADGTQPWSSQSGIYSISLSDNGHRIVFGGYEDKVYTSVLTGSRTGTSGWLNGEQGGSVTLTYQGNGQFAVSAYKGTLTVQ